MRRSTAGVGVKFRSSVSKQFQNAIYAIIGAHAHGGRCMVVKGPVSDDRISESFGTVRLVDGRGEMRWLENLDISSSKDDDGDFAKGIILFTFFARYYWAI